ncbi:CD72 protein, partial [Climacteris rufus]|nr:CD72 protein [Climacteris rufus]
MAQSVVYADLKFAAGPPATVPDDDDSPYENVPLGPVTAAPSPGGDAGTPRRRAVAAGPRGDACVCSSLAERWTRRWRVPTGLLAAGLLLLLLLVAIVALGACYWQVTRSLQDASREHVAEQGRLSQELQAREQSLEQTQRELGWAREALRQAWHEHNMTQRELRSRNAELGHAQQKLAVLQEEMQEVQGKLNSSERAVSSLRACVNTECCPEGWILYRSKCLYFSVTQQNWDSSFLECRDRSARLLSEGDWPSFTLP